MKLKRITSKRRQNYFPRRPSQLQARAVPPLTCKARETAVSRLGFSKKVHTHSILFEAHDSEWKRWKHQLREMRNVKLCNALNCMCTNVGIE